MPSFMMEIEAAQRAPLDQLAMDFFQAARPSQPSIDICRRMCGLPDQDAVVAKRLNVAIAAVRGWREVGRRANWSCW
jgi:hypothetical protein